MAPAELELQCELLAPTEVERAAELGAVWASAGATKISDAVTSADAVPTRQANALSFP